MPSDAIGRTSRRSAWARGKYSSRSAAVSRPSAAAASCARFGNAIGGSSRDGCGVERIGVASSSGVSASPDAKPRGASVSPVWRSVRSCFWGTAAGAGFLAMPLMIAGAADLLDGEQVPPRRLAALVEVQLQAVGQRPLDLVLTERSAGAGDAGDELAVHRQLLDRLAQHLPELAPRDQLVAGVADGVAGAEAALRAVPGGRRHTAGGERGYRSPERGGVVLG